MDLGMFCTTSHILGETCECSAPLSTYWHGHANIMHLSAHIRKSMPIYCSTWHIFTGLSEYIRRSIPMFCYYWHGIRAPSRHSSLYLCRGPRTMSSYLPRWTLSARLVIHRQTTYAMDDVRKRSYVQTVVTLLSTEFRARNHAALEHIDIVIGHGRSGVPLTSTRLRQHGLAPISR